MRSLSARLCWTPERRLPSLHQPSTVDSAVAATASTDSVAPARRRRPITAPRWAAPLTASVTRRAAACGRRRRAISIKHGSPGSWPSEGSIAGAAIATALSGRTFWTVPPLRLLRGAPPTRSPARPTPPRRAICAVGAPRRCPRLRRRRRRAQAPSAAGDRLAVGILARPVRDQARSGPISPLLLSSCCTSSSRMQARGETGGHRRQVRPVVEGRAVDAGRQQRPGGPRSHAPRDAKSKSAPRRSRRPDAQSRRRRRRLAASRPTPIAAFLQQAGGLVVTAARLDARLSVAVDIAMLHSALLAQWRLITGVRSPLQHAKTGYARAVGLGDGDHIPQRREVDYFDEASRGVDARADVVHWARRPRSVGRALWALDHRRASARRRPPADRRLGRRRLQGGGRFASPRRRGWAGGNGLMRRERGARRTRRRQRACRA